MQRSYVRLASAALAIGWTLMNPQPALGQIATDPPPPGARTQTMPAGARYEMGGFRRWLYGSEYRNVWTAPIEVPVLNLDSVGGGLTPQRTGGFGQSVSLHFAGADGRRYVVRSVDKDPTKRLIPELKDTFIEGIVQDQISALHPTAALVVDPIMEATGVLHTKHRLVVIPDDPRLGEYRDEFAGLMGMLVLHPDEGPDNVPGFAGSRRIIGTEQFFEELESGPCNRVDAPAFLKARLVDMVIGDKDRHEGQWRWAAFPDGDCRVWRPIPEDRDQAFVDFDGVVMWATRRSRPQQIRFQEKFPNILGLTFNGWEVDRQVLAGLDQSAWDSIVAAVQRELSDDVIENAVRRMPAPHYELTGEYIAHALKTRRTQLPGAADEYYRLISRWPDVWATDEAELAEITHQPNGDVRITIAAMDGDGSSDPYFDRTFRAGDSKGVRLYLRGGDDRAVVRGQGGGIVVRVIGGGGDDQLVNESQVGGKQTRFYDSRGENEFVRGVGARVNEKPFKRPPSKDQAHRYALDWGGVSLILPFIYYSPDLGVYFGGWGTWDRYGFRKVPYTSRYTVSAGFATNALEPRVAYDSWHRAVFGDVDTRLHFSWSGLEILNYFGLGNNTTADQPSSFYKVEQRQVEAIPALEWRIVKAPATRRSEVEEDDIPGPAIVGEPINDPLTISIAPVVKFSNTPEGGNEGRFIAQQADIYGGGSFGEVGVAGAVTVDTRDAVVYPRQGVLVRLAGTLYPEAWDVVSTFGEVHGEAATYLTAPIPAEPTLALRVAGKKVWGEFPFFEAAFLGGASSIRGYRRNRYAGDASVYGNAELRFRFSRIKLLVPIGIGAFGGVDVGRVFYDGDPADADKLHTAFGGGLWFAFIDRRGTASAGIMSGEDITGFYLQTGFAF